MSIFVVVEPFVQYLDSKLESHLKLDWYNEQAVKSEARRQANQPVRIVTVARDEIQEHGVPHLITNPLNIRRLWCWRIQQKCWVDTGCGALHDGGLRGP